MQIIAFHLQWVVVQSVAERLTLWFRNNCMKVNPDKFHLLLSDKKSHQVDICNKKFSSTCSGKLLGVKIDNKLTFEEHEEGLCKKASQKISTAAGILSLMRLEQRKRIVNLFITSHFSYCSLVWMFHNRRLNNCIDHIHERTYQDYNSSFKELLRKFLLKDLIDDRTSYRKCSVRKVVLRNFTKFTRKHLGQSLFLNKVAGLNLQLY